MRLKGRRLRTCANEQNFFGFYAELFLGNFLGVN